MLPKCLTKILNIYGEQILQIGTEKRQWTTGDEKVIPRYERRNGHSEKDPHRAIRDKVWNRGNQKLPWKY